ncbi:MAG TPA: AmmeMemoRadiSam system protein A [Pyrinomonadaceae bacterium]|jgi:AmmeMemoRadiSam system protein A/AmmeMemoRadiSam system protein B|nr:AmmeMemoRadiSam system protein A [Pyrinomonadaceae bacterium]
MATSYMVFAGIAPHPPIMVPEVGREAITDVRGSIEAMRDFTERIIASGAETVIIISPHAPLEAHAFVAYNDEHLYGDFAGFRAPDTKVEVPLDKELLEAIERAAAEQNHTVVGIDGYALDHGTAVPLYFLQRNGWKGSVVALGYNFLSNEDHLRFGLSIKHAVDTTRRSAAFVASGDLSHRLKPGAPAGYNADAHLFDKEVVACLREGEPSRIVAIDQDLRRMAGECGYRSMLVALGTVQEIEQDCEVLHYEAPFGVGYMVAQLARRPSMTKHTKAQKTAATEESSTAEQPQPQEEKEEVSAAAELLPALARRAVEAFVRDGLVIEAPPDMFDQRAACFVSIKTARGDLRGCIGTIEPVKQTLAQELIANAINAATRDPRFTPITAKELPQLRYSVDVLSTPEPARFEDLDPAVYGVIVEDAAGQRRGLLLPDLKGIETARQQVEIATRKAGIAPGTPLKFSRFRVERFRESTPSK